MATIKDIAQAAGVSTWTVSTVLGGKRADEVALKTRQRVEAIAKKMDYVVDDMARSFKTGRSKVIGYVYASLAPETLMGMLAGANDNGYGVEPIFFDTQDPDAVARVVQCVRMKRMSAVSVNIALPETVELIEELKELDIPLVFSAALSHNAPKGILEIISDTALAMRLISDHLIERGHRNILYVNSGSDIGIYRYELMTDYLKSIYLDVEVPYVCFDTYSHEEFNSRFFGPYADAMPTAIVCSNPGAATIVSHRCFENGFKIPDDISIVSYGDYLTNSFLGMTCLHEKSREMGRCVSESLINMVENNISNHYAEKLLDVDLIIRGSVKDLNQK